MSLDTMRAPVKARQAVFYLVFISSRHGPKTPLLIVGGSPAFSTYQTARSYKLSPAVVPFVKEKTKTEQDETSGVAVSTNKVASKKTEIGNAEQTAKMLKDEIKSLGGGQRAAIILEANLKQGETKRILELADTTHLQLEATIADSYAQFRRTTGLTALD